MATRLTLLGEEPHAALIERSTRRRPSLLVQGDTLSVAAQTAKELVEQLSGGTIRDARYSAQELAETLQDWLGSYERMMKAADRDLPYDAE